MNNIPGNIPASCSGRPTTPDGLVIPFGNVQLADGGCDFRSHHHSKWLRCWEQALCQVCGNPPGPSPFVMLCGPRQLAQLLFDEPPVCPACARYVMLVCPMVTGQRSHYRTGDTLALRSRGHQCFDPGCDCGGWVPTPGLIAAPGGDPAHEWYAVWVRDFALAATSDGRIIGGISRPEQVIRVRLVSEPGQRHSPWLPVLDWVDRYAPPAELQEATL